MSAIIVPLPGAAAVPPPNVKRPGRPPRGVVSLSRYRNRQPQPAPLDPTVGYQQELNAMTPAQKAEGLLLTAYDLVSRAREILGRPPLPPLGGPESRA